MTLHLVDLWPFWYDMLFFQGKHTLTGMLLQILNFSFFLIYLFL